MIFTENEDDLIDSERENVDDPMCKGSYSEWSTCTPKCKNSDNEKGKRIRSWKYEKGSHKMCSVSALMMIRSIFSICQLKFCLFFLLQGRGSHPQIVEECEIDWCVAPNPQVKNW